jgi:hypothetical protein
LFNFSNRNSPVLYSISTYLGKYSNTTSVTNGNLTAFETYSIMQWTVPLPGGYNDPETKLTQSVSFVMPDQNNAPCGFVNGTGLFNWVYGGDITGIWGGWSTASVNNSGYSWCHTPNTIVQGAGTTIGTVQETAGAQYCVLFASDWWDAWPGVGLNSLNGTPYQCSTPWSDAGPVIGCQCGTATFPPVPTG